MKFLTALCITITVALSGNTHATLIDNGLFTSDTATGLDWLDLSVSAGQAYNSAATQNDGWRYATNEEVEDLFNTAFEGYYSHRPDDYAFSQDYTHYAGLKADAINWWGLFGGTTSSKSLGMYRDENNFLRTTGVTRYYSTGWFVYGKNYSTDLSDQADNHLDSYGTFLVRDTEGYEAPIPEPAIPALFITGIAGFIVSRIKSR